MNQKNLYYIWGGLFILCAGLGFIPEPQGAVKFLLTVLSLLFFLPPLLLLRSGRQEAQLVRNLSLFSLGLTALFLILNFLCAFGSELLGTMLHYILTVVSAPMIACGNWALSLFLWACLLMLSMKTLKK